MTTNQNIGVDQFKCPFCIRVYSSSNLKIDENLNNCEHLLLNYKTVSHLNSTYRVVSDLTGNLLGNNVPLVIAKRFIRYIRDQKTGQTGIYTIHQSKARISSTFQGITSFSLRLVENEQDNDKTTTTIEHNYYLTQNPIQESTLFESFVLQNYIDSISSSTTATSSSGTHELYLTLSKEQIKPYLDFEDQDANYSKGLDYENNNGGNNIDLKTLLHRWILITGLPNSQLPSFVMLDSHKLDLTNNLTFKFPITSTTNSNNNNNDTEFELMVHPIFPLPNIAIQS